MEKQVTMADFTLALEEVKCSFGVDNENLKNSVRGGIIHYSDDFTKNVHNPIEALTN
jgi:hypothetical protein